MCIRMQSQALWSGAPVIIPRILQEYCLAYNRYLITLGSKKRREWVWQGMLVMAICERSLKKDEEY